MRNIFLFLLVLLLKRISSDKITKQKEIASEVNLENGDSENEILIRTVSLNPTKKQNYNEVRKNFVKQNKCDNPTEKNKVSRVIVQRKRDTANETYFQGMECLSCHGVGLSTSDLNCYKGSQIASQKCSDFEQCFTEYHPQYIKRGCILPLYINRTFVCKCPLCNDKPSQDSTYYDYKSLSDWSYDNKRLEKPVIGLELPCKYCETRGLKPEDDVICKEGRNTDFMICGQNQICFTIINSEMGFVSRGCIDLPAFNSMYYYCNKTNNCNNKIFKPPTREKLKLTRKVSALIGKVEDVKDDAAKNKTMYNYLKINPDKVLESKNPLPYFRRQVEEITGDIPVERVTEDSRGKLLSLLVKNVKEIFNDITEPEPIEYDTPAVSTPGALERFDADALITVERSTREMPEFRDDNLITVEHKNGVMPKIRDNVVTIEHTNDVMLYENFSVINLDRELDELFPNLEISTSLSTISRKKLKKTVNEMKSFEKSNVIIEKVTPVLTSISSYVLESTDVVIKDEPKKTCIHCNNVLHESCIDPKNKLVPSVMCKRENDICYSMNTPFGIIDRGCFNVNHNLTTYVCTSNLCNYVSISEMPYIFSKVQDWVDNIIELSRTRNFRKSIFKNMSCLRCEVNTTNKTGNNMADNANCLQGNVAFLPIQDCKEDEICGVKAVRSDGYIWRGCLKAPLYNYWWAFCDHDLCNYDTLMSIYDYKIA